MDARPRGAAAGRVLIRAQHRGAGARSKAPLSRQHRVRHTRIPAGHRDSPSPTLPFPDRPAKIVVPGRVPAEIGRRPHRAHDAKPGWGNGVAQHECTARTSPRSDCPSLVATLRVRACTTIGAQGHGLIPSMRPVDRSMPSRFPTQAVTDTPVYADPDDVLDPLLPCKTCCSELKSDWALVRLPDCKSWPNCENS